MSWSWCLLKTESAAKVSASTRCWTKLAKAASMSRLLVAFWTMIVSPRARAAACTSVVSDWEAGFFGLTSKPITVALGTSSCSNSSRLGASVLYRKLVPVTLPPGRFKAGYQTKLDRVSADRENDRNGRRCRFGRERRRGALDRNDYGHLAANQIGRQRRQSVQLTFRPAVLHCDVAALEIAGFVEASPDRVERGGFTIGAAEQTDHRHRRLLRARRERPSSHSAT